MAAPPILTLSNIELGFGGPPLFKNLEFSIPDNARLCLVGRNGSGKSTAMKIMAGLVEPDTGTRFVQPGKMVGYLDQDPNLSAYPTLRDFAVSGLAGDSHYQVDRIADGIKLDLEIASDVASGGEKRRAALVKILAEAPELMLLDEPTNHLDIQAISWLEDQLSQTKSAFVLISHDRAFLRRLTKGILWLDRGEMRNAPYGFDRFEDWRDKTFEEEDQARHKLNRLIKSEARWAVEGISARRKRNQGRVRRLQDLKSQRSEQIKRQGAAALTLGEGQKSGKLVVEAKEISKSFGDHKIVSDFSIKIARGDRIALVGPNGVGKTTLLKMLTGLLAPDAGTVKAGTNLLPVYFDQTRDALNPDASLWDTMTDDKEIGISGKNDQIMVRGTARHVVGYLKEFLFDETQIKGPVSVLSGGEKARLLLAKLMARESNFLILDEPTNDLDIETLDLLQEILDEYEGTVLLVSHDRDFIDRVATRTLAFEGRGKITIYAGGWSDYQSQKLPADVQSNKKKSKQKQIDKPQSESSAKGLSFAQKHRLEKIPSEMERLEAEIQKLEAFLSDPDLFTREPVKFQKASDGLVERQKKLAEIEDEWLELETIVEDSA